MDYIDFILRISPGTGPNTFAVCASSVGEGEARSAFSPPFDETQLENFVLKVGLTRRGVRRIHSPEWQTAQAFGQKLFSALFTEELRALLHSGRNAAQREGKGLRLKIVLDAPALANYPWEYLYEPSLGRFTTLFQDTSLVRYVELPFPVTPLQVAPPLQVLVLTSSPRDYQPLDVQREREALSRPLTELQQRGLLTVRWLEHATLDSLRETLLSDRFHVFHFVGHGAFDESSKDAVLVFNDPSGQGRPVSVERLAILLGNHPTLRLVVLNACEGARTSVQDPFAGAAMTLVRTGEIPAVVAMQFEITDGASIAFSLGFYEAIARGKPVDAAVTEGRLAILAQGNDVEWGTPVLYLRAPDGVIFAPPVLEKPTPADGPAVKPELSAPVRTHIERAPEGELDEARRIDVQQHAGERIQPEGSEPAPRVPERTEVQPLMQRAIEAGPEIPVETKGEQPAPKSAKAKAIALEKQGEERPGPCPVVAPQNKSRAPRLAVALGAVTLILLCTVGGCCLAPAIFIRPALTRTPTGEPVEITTGVGTPRGIAAPSRSGAPLSPTFTPAITATPTMAGPTTIPVFSEITISPAPTATTTVGVRPSPTVPTMTPVTICPIGISPQFASAIANQTMGCPVAHEVRVAAAMMSFQNGWMFWGQERAEILVMYGTSWERYPDTFDESEKVSICAPTPPSGMYVPVRGFGKVWCGQAKVRQGLGWGLGPEAGFASLIQDFQNGWAFTDNQGRTILAFANGAWVAK